MLINELSPSIICVTESWLDKNFSDDCLSFSNYTLFRSDRQTGHKGGGICVCTVTEFHVSFVFSITDNTDVEALILRISYNTFHCILVTLYFPHGLLLNAEKVNTICKTLSDVIDDQLLFFLTAKCLSPATLITSLLLYLRVTFA